MLSISFIEKKRGTAYIKVMPQRGRGQPNDGRDIGHRVSRHDFQDNKSLGARVNPDHARHQVEQETEGICQPVLRKENLGTTQIVAHIDQNSDVGAAHVSHKLQQTVLGSLSSPLVSQPR